MDSLILADCGSDEYTNKLEEQVLELSKLLQQLHAADAGDDNSECDGELAVPTSKRKRHTQLKRLRRILPGVGKKEATQLPADDNTGESDNDNEEVSPEYIDACECRLNALQDELRVRREIEFDGSVATGIGTVPTLENDQGSSSDEESSIDDNDSIIAMAKRLDNTKGATIDDPSHMDRGISFDIDTHHRKKTKDNMHHHHHKSKKVGSSSTDQTSKKTKKKQIETTKRNHNLDKNKKKPIPRKSRVQKMQGSGHAIRLSSRKSKVVNDSTKMMGSSRKQSDEKDRKKIDRNKT